MLISIDDKPKLDVLSETSGTMIPSNVDTTIRQPYMAPKLINLTFSQPEGGSKNAIENTSGILHS